MKKILLLITPLLVVVSCSSGQKKESVVSTSRAKAIVNGKVSGEVRFLPTAEGVVMEAYIKGLEPNKTHGFHIHENGLCEQPDYKSAGDHFNPSKHSHGGPAAPIKHLGDLGNLISNKEGIAEKEVLMRDLKDVNLIKNKAIIIHANADDLVSQPSGDAGDRMACGVIVLE